MNGPEDKLKDPTQKVVADPQPKLVVGQAFPDLGERYVVIDVLGSGGTGTVYKVRDTALDKEFAVKVLNESLVQDKLSVKRFEQEADAASNLTHANLAAVYEYGLSKTGAPYLVMDYLSGNTLEQILKQEGYLDVSRALDLFIQITEAIGHAHLKGVIHRDIKPSNIIVEQGEHKIEHVKVLDFGIAKVLPSEQHAQNALTQTGDIFGTPLYMSPEQCQGNMQDVRSDIYSLGCVMYKSLMGVDPFAAENPIRIILRHVNGDAKPFAAVNREAGVSSDLESVVMRCLQLDPAQRYQTANELLFDLRRVRDGKRVKPLRRKNRLPQKSAIATGAAATLGLVAGGIALLVLLQSPPPTPRTVAPATDSLTDAQTFDLKSYQYFMSGQYRKALPLLQFGIPAYEEKLVQDNKRRDKQAALQDETWLAENWQHIGKCYLAIGKDAQTAGNTTAATDNFQKAREAYKQAMPFYLRYGNWAGGSTPEMVRDYAETLRQLKDEAELTKLKNFADRWRLSM